MREFLKRTLPTTQLDALRQARQTLRFHCGLPLRGGEAVVTVLNNHAVEKRFLPGYFAYNREFDRPHEGEILLAHQDAQFVQLLEYDNDRLILERLGQPVGDCFRVLGVQDPNALVSFLDTLEETLLNHDLRHHDIHPGNILYNPAEEKYQLIDFGWARHVGETYRLPQHLNSKYSSDDARAIDMVKREADAFLARPSFLSALVPFLRGSTVENY